MSELKKSDCISVQKAISELGIVRNTLNAYMNALDMSKHKFAFDNKTYIRKSDYERLIQFIEEHKSEEA